MNKYKMLFLVIMFTLSLIFGVNVNGIITIIISSFILSLYSIKEKLSKSESLKCAWFSVSLYS